MGRKKRGIEKMMIYEVLKLKREKGSTTAFRSVAQRKVNDGFSVWIGPMYTINISQKGPMTNLKVIKYESTLAF